jgi:hypothetical protein
MKKRICIGCDPESVSGWRAEKTNFHYKQLTSSSSVMHGHYSHVAITTPGVGLHTLLNLEWQYVFIDDLPARRVLHSEGPDEFLPWPLTSVLSGLTAAFGTALGFIGIFRSSHYGRVVVVLPWEGIQHKK